jgi:hypothetical protein
MGASIKIMLSYDYCHFEVCKSTDAEITDKEINEMRKDAQRLADEAVRQYKIAKTKAANRAISQSEFESECLRITKIPIDERTPMQKAMLKQYSDEDWRAQFEYDYDDEDQPDFQ